MKKLLFLKHDQHNFIMLICHLFVNKWIEIVFLLYIYTTSIGIFILNNIEIMTRQLYDNKRAIEVRCIVYHCKSPNTYFLYFMLEINLNCILNVKMNSFIV